MTTPTRATNNNSKTAGKDVASDLLKRLWNRENRVAQQSGEGEGGWDACQPKWTVALREDELTELCVRARVLLLQEQTMVDVDAPIKVCGDIHGQFEHLLMIFTKNGEPSDQCRYLFLGDYVDRGPHSLETVALLLAYKVKCPSSVTLLRGNHEAHQINITYGFFSECAQRLSIPVWQLFQDVFNVLPLCARISKRIFCAHGGISQDFKSWAQIQAIKRPCDIPESGIVTDLLWADPDPTVSGFMMSPRGASYVFGVAELKQFNAKADIDLVARAHQVVEDGYEFFADRQLVTLFSAPFYCGEFENAAATMHVDRSLCCTFTLIRPSRATVETSVMTKSSKPA